MKKSIVCLGIALVSFVNVAVANTVNVESVAASSSVTRLAPTPLCNAIAKGETEVAKKFVEFGANVNEKGDNDMTPLMFAARYNNLEVVKLLLENGANIKDKSSNGFTALKWAEASGAKEVAEFLKTYKK